MLSNSPGEKLQGRAYRSKLAPPCDACRKRRIGCARSADEPACSLCKLRGTVCTFLTAPSPRAARLRNGKNRNSHGRLSTVTTSPNETSGPVQAASHLDDDGQHSTHAVVNRWNVRTTSSKPHRTCLYSGASADQGSSLFEHLKFADDNCFGDNRWTVWKIDPRPDASSYFTVLPNNHLDCHAEMYAFERIEKLFEPYQNHLIDLYYIYVHPVYPILESKSILCAKRRAGDLPISLLAMIYYHGAEFWSCSPELEGVDRPELKQIRPYVFTIITFESRTPNLAVIQAVLLFMQIPPFCIREPNHPGFWALTSMLTAMAQDIGLHKDPKNWNLAASERKLRRILWWAVYIHDKWMCHWLGRPSHINYNSYDVTILTLEDFTNEQDMMCVDEIYTAQSFIALTELSVILSSVVDELYSARSSKGIVSCENLRNQTTELLSQLQGWRQTHERTIPSQEHKPRHCGLLFAAFAVDFSINRAILTESQPHDTSTAIAEIHDKSSKLISILYELELHGERAFWLSYSKGNLSIAGSVMIMLALYSSTTLDLQSRRQRLQEYQDTLTRLSQNMHNFEFALLPLHRLNMIVKELIQTRDAEDDWLNTAFGTNFDPSVAGSYNINDLESSIWADFLMNMG